MEQEKLQKVYQDAVAVKEMMNTAGWKVLSRELDAVYASNVVKLIEKEEVEARIKIKSVVEVRQLIDYILSQGKRANEELTK